MILDIENPVENPIRAYIGDNLVWQDTGGPTLSTLAELFIDGEQGVWLDPSDISTMFQDARGVIPVTRDGDPVVLMRDKSGNNNHAVQSISAARPIYKDDPARLSLDKVDDALVIKLPSRLVGTMTIASTTGTATYGVDIPSGNFKLGGKYPSSDDIVGLIL